MVFGHEAPVARVGRVVAVVAHHPVIVHLECVAVGGSAVDVDNAVAHGEVVALIVADYALIDGQIIKGELQCGSLLGNPYLAIVGACPAIVVSYGIHIHHLTHRHTHCVLYPAKGIHLLKHLGSERHLIDGRHRAVVGNGETKAYHTIFLTRIGDGNAVAVVDAHAKVLPSSFIDFTAVGLNQIVILHILRLGNRLTVDIHYIILDLQHLAGQTYATLHIVLAAVNGAIYHIAIFCLVAANGSRTTRLKLAQGIVVGVLHLQSHSVACREVKHHNVEALHAAHTFQAVILPLRIVDIRLAVEHRQRVLCQREVQRCVGHARSIHHLVHPQIVAHKQRLLERRRGYLVVLSEEKEDEIHQHQGIHYGIDPPHHCTHGSILGVFPPRPRNELREVDIGKQWQEQNHPPRAKPNDPAYENSSHNGEAGPAGGLHTAKTLTKSARLLHIYVLFIFLFFFHNQKKLYR